MPRRPKENYYQVTGKPHAGLHNPEKYGLTYNQVLQLVTEGKWDAFRQQWIRDQKGKERIIRYRYTCPRCKLVVPDVEDWNKSGRFCKKCDKRSENGKNIFTCKICGKSRAVRIQSPFQICSECEEILKGLVWTIE